MFFIPMYTYLKVVVKIKKHRILTVNMLNLDKIIR
ncbi:hypothetical protein BPJM79_30551 [Bacillus pumilus]